MQDQYESFEKLKAAQKDDVDYRIVMRQCDSEVAIIAPHAGFIEHDTGPLAMEIAGDDLSLYCFEALLPGKRQSPGSQHPFHITSHHFDEPCCLKLVAASTLVVAIHGRADRGDGRTIYLGGLDRRLARAIDASLKDSGFAVKASRHPFPATEPMNICNRGRNSGGAQIELPHSLRYRLRRNHTLRAAFVAAVRTGIQQTVAGPSEC